MAFVHLHNRSGLSLLDGAMTPTALAQRAAELGMPAAALTDTCNLYGSIEFAKACKSADIQAVFGASIWMWPPGLSTIKGREPDAGWEILLLAKGGEHAQLDTPYQGMRNLFQLITTAIFDGMHHRPRIDWELLERHHEGLIALTCGLNGPLGAALADRSQGPDQARADLQRLADIFGPEHLYVELADTGMPGQPQVNALARQLAGELGLDTVVTNDTRYLQPTDAVTLDLLNCVARGTPVDDPARQALPTDQQYVKSEAEMRALFPDDGPALDRTVDIARRCDFHFHNAPPYFFPATDPPDPDPSDEALAAGSPRADTGANWRYFYEAFPPPRDYGLPDPADHIPAHVPGAGNLSGYLRWYAGEGLKLRLRDIPEDRHPAYWERLDYEIGIINRMGFPAYLLIVAEFINWAKDNGIPVGPGRGSGAGAVTNWAMRITDLDPLRFDLLFERFLNPERISMPDIDVDFCQDRREEVIVHVSQKYGPPLVSQIITYGKLQAKAALKDVARICGVDFTAANRIAKLVPDELGIKLSKALEEERFRKQAEGDPLVGRIVALARRVEGMVRQTGVHAAGVVIADRPLVEHAPLYRDGPDGGPVVQFDMKSVEPVGLIKFDFLGLKTLDQIRDAVMMIVRNTGEPLDISRIPMDDPASFELLQKGDALGVFQVESSGMRDLLQRLKPSSIDDLIALVALYRPGPLQSGMVDSFIDCKHGRKPIEYPHPVLKPILESTYGSIVYQEQVMQVARVFAGYSLGEADMLRRAMGKKKKSVMDQQRARFVEGALALEHTADEANGIFDTLAYFAGYGFNKSHSAAYGYIAYQTAWLKAHHRAEYMAALMTIEGSNNDKVLVYIGDCRRAGIQVLPPDVNHSLAGFDVPKDQPGKIRFGLSAVKGIGDAAVQDIIEARDALGGRFESLTQMLEHIDLRKSNKKVLEAIIKCGALDWTGHPRRAMFDGLEAAMSAGQRARDDRNSGQTSLFGGSRSTVSAPRIQLPDVGEWPTAIKLAKEREALGFFITGHPVEAFRSIIKRAATCSIRGLDAQPNEKTVRVAGMVSTVRQVKTRRGDRMAFVSVADTAGTVECVFFSEPWSNSQRVLTSEQPVLVSGKLEKSPDGDHKIIAESAELLSEVRERRTRAVHLVLQSAELQAPGRLTSLIELLAASKGTCPLHLHVRFPTGWGSFALPAQHAVTPDEPLFQGLETLFRRADVPRLA